MPKVSIVTINLNNREGLESTVKSVINQTFADFEYIVIDGGSTDGSVDVIKKYEDKISFWISEKDSGIYNAMNKGIKKACGEYCLFLNSGDYFTKPNVLEEVYTDCRPTEDIVYGDMIIDRGGGKTEYGIQPSKISFEFLIENTLWHPVSFIKRQLFEKYGYYNEEYKIVSDYEFFLQTIILGGVTTKHIPTPIVVFNTNGIGSKQEFDEIHQIEKRAAQEKLFSKEIIATAKRLNDIKKSNLQFIEPIDKYPKIKKFLIFIGNFLIKSRRFILK